MKNALIVWGGWDGHKPDAIAGIFEKELKNNGFTVRVENSLAPLEDKEAVKKYDLIFPCWTMSEISAPQWEGLNDAIMSGVGLGGIHGGMGDAFRANLSYQWMVGGQFVGHPHVGDYDVRVTCEMSPITEGVPLNFPYNSEQYYMLVDPGMRVLAETTYVCDGNRFVMPVVWTKAWGKGRVFYNALGHDPAEFTKYPHVLEMTVRGLLWAAR